MKIIDSIATPERISRLRDIREKKRNEGFAALYDVIGEEAIAELREMYNLFDERMLIWYAGLYDSDIGGFYFSETSRDNEGFLPDLESTAQALKFIKTQCGLEGIGEPIQSIPRDIGEKIYDFAYNLQDEDGFFYHPQWGKDITESRRGRDLGNAAQLIALKGKYKYPLPLSYERKAKPAVPDYLQDIDKYKHWISERPFSTKSYAMGNLINSICGQIRDAGHEFACATIDWLDSIQRTDNGLWERDINYASVNGLMKIAISYPVFNAKIKHATAAFESAVHAITSNEPIEFACEFYNPWAAVSAILSHGDLNESEKAAMRARLRECAPEMIRATTKKMKSTQTNEGNFAYFSASSGECCAYAQGARVSLDNVWESDINGNGCSVNGPLREMFKAFGIPIVPVFTQQDADLVFDIMRLPTQKNDNLQHKEVL